MNPEEIKSYIHNFSSPDKEDIENFRVSLLGKNGKVKALLAQIKDQKPEQRKAFGQAINELKNLAQNKIKHLQKNQELAPEDTTDFDPTMPVSFSKIGSRHPITLVKNKIVEIFNAVGFSLCEGPEIEDDWHNFEALNFEENHPARDMQDTFFIENPKNYLLRTHTSSVQIRMMKKSQPPIKILAPGRVYRNETISARSHCFFHQIEGLYIDTNVSFSELKGVLLYFVRAFFGDDVKVRTRPSFFPFTEPSAETDISCTICSGKGCRVCKYNGWLEILGCGMVDPNVLENCDIDSEKYTGYAFGMGLERIAMLQYGVKDIRLLFENDIRILEQFS